MADEIRITAEPQPISVICKFTADRPLFDGAVFFESREKAQGSPLIERIFELGNIADVLVAENRLTVTQSTPQDWSATSPQIGSLIRAQLQSGEPGIAANVLDGMPSEEKLREEVERLFEAEINPSIAAHGGFVKLIEVKKNNVYLQLGGGCRGCHMANYTLKMGIEKAIRQKLPQVGEVLDTTDHGTGNAPYFTPDR